MITASFHRDAECCNTENLLVTHHPELVVACAENFARRRAVSVEYAKTP
jgi:hypothetical protein